MTDIPVIFSGPMIQALLAGRKQMTRRLAWRPAKSYPGVECRHGFDACPKCDAPKPSPWQKVKPGDRLWTRENWKPHSIYEAIKPRDIPQSSIFYAADNAYAPSNTRWRPSIFMPRWASRLTLVVTATKIEPLHYITEDDAVDEGCFRVGHNLASQMFQTLWTTLHGAESWNANPAVVAVSFSIHKVNIDSLSEVA